MPYNALPKVAEQSEAARQAAIRHFGLTDSDFDEIFDGLCEQAAKAFDVPIATLSVLLPDRQTFRGAFGIGREGTDREVAFCNYTVEQREPLIVEEALEDARFANNPLVTGDPNIRFYAGAPVVVGDDVAIGSFCLIDSRPRHLPPGGEAQLALMAKTVSSIIEMRLAAMQATARERRLEENAQILRTTIDSIGEGVAVWDADLNLVLWNRLFFDLFGYDDQWKRSGVNAATLMRIAAARGDLGAGDPDQIVAGLVESIRTTPNRRIQIDTVDGRTLDVWRSAMPGGGSIITVNDVTERVAMGRMKDEFVSTVSHELRTPLTSIRGSLALLSRDPDNSLGERGGEMLAMALKNSERLSRLIDDILDIEKLTSGASEFLSLPTVLQDAIEEATAINKPFAERLGVSIASDVPMTPIVVAVDPGRLLQVLTNLISNAAKHSPQGGEIRIHAEVEMGRVIVRVTDDGPGVGAQFVPQLFKRFSQEKASERPGVSGTGLGLAISRAIIDRMGGQIGYKERDEGGACFWFELPVEDAA